MEREEPEAGDQPTAVMRERDVVPGREREGVSGHQPLPPGRALQVVKGEVRDPSFSLAVRGYDRREVDAYVERVNALIAELELGGSPQSAVRAALDRVAEQTANVLQSAREAAEELTATAVAESEHATRRARVEARELLERAGAEAASIREQSASEAEELLARAREEAAALTADAQEHAQAVRENAHTQLRSLREDLGRAAARRRRAVEEIRRTAADLEAFAAAVSARAQAPDDRGQEDPGGGARDRDEERTRGARGALPPRPGQRGAEDDAAANAPLVEKPAGEQSERASRQGDALSEWAASAAHSD